MARVTPIVVAVLLVLHCRLGFVEAYDPDEFVHLHAGLCLTYGLIPYRDYFQHHGPVTYALGGMAAALVGPSPALLVVDRALSFLLVLAALRAVWILTLRCAGTRFAWVGVVWLLLMPWFADKALEWRPDVLALTLLAWAAVVGSSCPSPPASFATMRRAWLVGLLIGLASLCTPKVVFAGFGLMVGSLVAQAGGRWRWLAGVALGGTTPWLLCFALFASFGAGFAFIRSVLYYPLIWPCKVNVTGELLRELIDWSPAPAALGVLALFSTFAAWRRPTERTLHIACLFHWLILPIQPAAYMQYHALALPLLAPLVARLLRIVRLSVGRKESNTLIVVAASIATAFAGSMISRTTYVGGNPPGQTIILVGVAAAAAALLLWRRRRTAALAMIALGLMGPNLAWLYLHHVHLPRFGSITRTEQVLAVRELTALVASDQTVQDGFDGVACLRRHAHYWWWINEHSLRLMERIDDPAKVRREILEASPALLVVDRGLAEFLRPAAAEIERDYEIIRTSEPAGWHWLRRRDLPPAR